jgi:hypothetical protein
MTDTLPDNAHFGDADDEQLHRLAMRLRASNPIRQLALKHLCQLPLPEDATEQLLKAIVRPSGFRRREQELAITLLGHLSLAKRDQDQFWPALRRFITAKHWEEDSLRLNLLRISVMGFLPTLFIYLCGTGLEHFSGFLFCWLAFSLAGLFPLMMISPLLDLVPLNRLRVAAIRAAGKLQRSEMIGPVTTALGSIHFHEVRAAAIEALPRLLSTLTPEHYGYFSLSAVPPLCRALSDTDDTVVLMVLEALEKIGDGQAVVPVERLVTRGRTSALRAAAARILPILQARQQNENAPHILLRAATAPFETPDSLLRPALNAPTTEPQELLRATTTGEPVG